MNTSLSPRPRPKPRSNQTKHQPNVETNHTKPANSSTPAAKTPVQISLKCQRHLVAKENINSVVRSTMQVFHAITPHLVKSIRHTRSEIFTTTKAVILHTCLSRSNKVGRSQLRTIASAVVLLVCLPKSAAIATKSPSTLLITIVLLPCLLKSTDDDRT